MKKRNIVIVIIFAVAIAAILLVPGAAKQGAGGSGQTAAAGLPAGPPTGTPGVTVAAGSSGGKNPARSQRPATASTFSVRTEVVKLGTIQDYLETNGDIVVDSTVEVNPYASGKLVSIRTLLGSKVEQGQLIAEIDLSTPGSTYALNPVYAPISGTITSLPLAVGSKVGASSVIAKIGILDANGLQASAKIAERWVGLLRTGLKAVVSLEAYPGVKFAATVTRVSPVVDSTSRTKEIRLSFDRSDDRINAGMFARIKLNTVTYAGRLTISENAIVSDSTGDYVYVVGQDNTVAKRRVDVGVTVDGMAEMRSGLSEGDIVVVEGAAVLTDGARIKVVADKVVVP